MRITTLLFLSFISSVSLAQIMPEAHGVDMENDEAVVSCVFENEDLDFTTLKVNAAGDMVVRVNPKYLSSEEDAPYLIYKGFQVTMTSVDSQVTVRGTLLTLSGEVEIDLNLVRGKSNKVVIENQKLICDVM